MVNPLENKVTYVHLYKKRGQITIFCIEMMRKMNLLIFSQVNQEWKYMQIKVERLLKNLKDFKTLVFLHDVGKRKRNWKTFFSANLLGIYMDLHWSILQIYSSEIRGLSLMKCSSGHTFVIWKPRWFFSFFIFSGTFYRAKKKILKSVDIRLFTTAHQLQYL